MNEQPPKPEDRPETADGADAGTPQPGPPQPDAAEGLPGPPEGSAHDPPEGPQAEVISDDASPAASGHAPPGDQQEPPDVDALEADIRNRLKQLMARARKSKADAQTIFSKVKPMLQTGQALTEIAEDRNAAVGQLAERAKQGYSATGDKIREVAAGMQADVLLQREQIAGLDESSMEYMATIHAPAERLFRAIRRRNRELDQWAQSIRQWLHVAEERWKAGDPRAAQQQKAES